MREVKVSVLGAQIADEEVQEYITRGRLQQPHNELIGITISVDDEYADISYEYSQRILPQRFSVGDMIIEDFSSLNDAKQAEYLDITANDL